MNNNLRRGTASVAALAALVIFAIGCGDDEDSSPTPTSSGPTDTPAPTQTANELAINAAEEYLTSEGVGGEKGEFTAPLNCSSITEDSPGKFCVHDTFSTYAPGLVILRFAEKDNPDDKVWEIRLEPSGGDWQVTSAEPFELSE